VKIIRDLCRVWKTLTVSERRWLNSESMRSPDGGWRMRCKIIRNLTRGESPTVIARILRCSRSQVYRVANQFISDGLMGLVDHRVENGQLKVHEDYVAFVLTAVAGSPPQFGYERPTWTQELLVIVAEWNTGVRISITTMCRLLRRVKARHGRPKPRVECPWPKAAKTRRLNQIQRLQSHLRQGEMMVYVDEVDIHLNPKIGDDWMLRGQQKEVLTPGQNAKHYLAGAFNAETGRLDWVAGPRKTSALFIDLIDDLLRRYPHKRVLHVVLDNFKIHSSRAVVAAQLRWEGRVQLHFLPPYCPDYNRIERIWKDLHDNVTRNHTCRTMDDLLNRVTNYLKQRRNRREHAYVVAQ
jgi:transposase